MDMKFILTAKHWQLFLILLFGMFLNNFTVEGAPLVNTMLTVLGFLIIYTWPLVLGIELHRYLPERIEISSTLFLINGMISLCAYCIIIIISDGQGMTFTGWSALPAFYGFYAFLHLLAFPAKVLKSIEHGKKASFPDYLGYFIMILFWPIGIWFIQPRINKTVIEHTLADE
ncbi:hypothetical protein D770_05305 [Flammeovirgaceae bacterium 311]|nr:hypothetical protein D770_05305 [Flammeovirgaceae bacterium 311]